MTAEGWREAVIMAVHKHENGDDEMLNLMSCLLEHQDKAKSDLNGLGFGCIGSEWPNVINEITEKLKFAFELPYRSSCQ